ncbi:MAG: hypothetical protein ACRELA_08335 [Candidatus Rokuibacteriota bacterium]
MSRIAPIFRWSAAHPWETFWIAVAALFVGIFLLGMVDSLLYYPGFISILAPILLIVMAASFIRGVRVSWRRSKIGALATAVLPLLLVGIPIAIAISLHRDVERKARLAHDPITIAPLRDTIALTRPNTVSSLRTGRRRRPGSTRGRPGGRARVNTGPTTPRRGARASPSPKPGRRLIRTRPG